MVSPQVVVWSFNPLHLRAAVGFDASGAAASVAHCDGLRSGWAPRRTLMGHPMHVRMVSSDARTADFRPALQSAPDAASAIPSRLFRFVSGHMVLIRDNWLGRFLRRRRMGLTSGWSDLER